MKAEIAREMIRSRNHTPNPVLLCAALAGAGLEDALLAGLRSEIGSAMRLYCIQKRPRQRRVVFEVVLTGVMGPWALT
jgi:hypothetical protein